MRAGKNCWVISDEWVLGFWWLWQDGGWRRIVDSALAVLKPIAARTWCFFSFSPSPLQVVVRQPKFESLLPFSSIFSYVHMYQFSIIFLIFRSMLLFFLGTTPRSYKLVLSVVDRSFHIGAYVCDPTKTIAKHLLQTLIRSVVFHGSVKGSQQAGVSMIKYIHSYN